MKIEKCDVCKFTTKEQYKVSDIRSQYRGHHGVEHICKDCEKLIDEFIYRVNEILKQTKVNFVKKFISKLIQSKRKGEL